MTQITKETLNAKIATDLPTNDIKEIDAIDLRGVLYDMVEFTSQVQTPWSAVSPEEFGATDPTVDSYAAFASCITAAINTGSKIILGDRVYLTSQTLDFQELFVQGTDDSVIRAITNNMLVVKNGNLDRVEIDGDSKALWGWLLNGTNTFSPSAVRAANVNVINCTEYGMVIDGNQNNSFIGTFCQHCGIANMVLANGVKNCIFLNCTINSDPTNFPNACNLLYLFDSSNPHGFGLNTSWGQPTDHNTFFGGIMERTAVTNIKTLNSAGASSPNLGGQTNFYQYEFDGVTQITFDSSFDGLFNFNDCAILGDGSGAALASGTGNGATIIFHNYMPTSLPAGYNSAGVDMGMTCNNNLSKLLNVSLANFANGAPYGSSGVISAAYDVATRTINVVTTAGNGFVSIPDDNAKTIGWRAFSCDRLPLLRISFSLSGIVGASDVNLLATGSGTNIADFAAGSWQLLYQAQASDDGGFRFRTNGSGTAWSLSNFTLEYL